jgi:hypothetical protein
LGSIAADKFSSAHFLFLSSRPKVLLRLGFSCPLAGTALKHWSWLEWRLCRRHEIAFEPEVLPLQGTFCSKPKQSPEPALLFEASAAGATVWNLTLISTTF